MVYGDECVRGAHVCACSLAFRLDKQTMQKNALQLQKITCSYNKRALEAKCFDKISAEKFMTNASALNETRLMLKMFSFGIIV